MDGALARVIASMATHIRPRWCDKVTRVIIAREMNRLAQKTRFGLVIDVITTQLGLIRTLRGLTPKFGSFDDAEFDELLFEYHLASDARLAIADCRYWIRKVQARFFAGDYPSAIDASLKAHRLLWTSPLGHVPWA